MPDINSKKKMYELLQVGEFGNRPRQWASFDDLLGDFWSGLELNDFGIRSKWIRGICYYHRTFQDLSRIIPLLKTAYVISEGLPDNKLLIQGEVQDSPGGWELTYSRIPGLTMREAMQHDRHRATGITAKMLLKSTMTPADYENLERLFETYPGHVVEFSVFDCSVGVIPGSNTIIWEVRNY